jgi:serine/threonine protein phosphatase PrpC
VGSAHKSRATEVRERSALSKQLRLDVAQLTDVGRKRPHNEDNMAYVIPKDSQVMAKKGALFIVADGMGGHAAGEVASEIAVDTVSTAYYQDENDEIPLSLMNAIKRANALIHQRAAENMMRSGMGTTCVAAVVRGGVAYIANVGDSRAYLVRHGHSKQVSQDHSWVEEQVRAGLLTKDQARSHAQRNVITRALGTQAEVDVDVFTEILEDSDTFVLCSDGLSGPVGEDDLRAIINQYQPQESVYHLVERANENGGPDNITAIVIHIQEAGDDIPSALQYPVRVGSSGHLVDESTAILDRLPTSSLGLPASATRVDENRSAGRPLQVPAGVHFASQNEKTAPLTGARAPEGSKRRSRLLLPTILLIIALLLAGVGTTVAYFFLRPSDVQAGLNQADGLIQQAKGNINTDPGNALISLTKAQGYLRTAKNASLNPQQNDQLNTLQNAFTAEFKSALTAYNDKSSVALLPCNTFTPVTLSPTEATSAIATVPIDKNTTASYILGLDYNLYQVDAKNTLQRVSTVGADKILLIASDDTYLYTLTEAKASAGFTYRLHAFRTQNGKFTEKVNGGTVIKSTLLQSGQIPQLMTAWGGDIYVIATSSQSNQNQATVLNYNVNKLTTDPTLSPISISTGLVSAAALPSKQLFLLHSDGQIKSLSFVTSKPLELNVLLQGSVATPWSQDAQTFNVATPVATPTAPIANILTIPAPIAQTAQALLSASDINNVQHLYVADNTNHRVLDFVMKPASAAQAVAATPTAVTTPNPAATPVRAGGGVIGSASGLNEASASLQRQYLSASVVSDVKGLSFDTRTNQINLLTGVQSSAASNQVRIPVSSATACTPNP